MENENQNPSFFEKNAALIKGFFIGVLTLLLLIPTILIDNLIKEREGRKAESVMEVSSKWGNRQQMIGPILKLPYYQYEKVEKLNEQGKKEVEQTKTIEHAFFLPENLKINGTVSPEKRSRGIYDIVVYRSQMNFTGDFADLQLKNLNILPENIIWKDASIMLTISDLRGIEDEVKLSWNGKQSVFNSGTALNIGGDGITGISSIAAPIEILNSPNSKNEFKFAINLKGSESINFIPAGKTTEVNVSSNWPSPSFDGNFLPTKRSVTANGFSASWKVLNLNREFPQYWANIAPQSIQAASFGVKLITPNDNYQKTSRSSKYAILVIALTFLGFFFIEIINRKKIHPFNYILIGLALCIFYTLLLSISEFASFNISYIIAMLLTLGLIFLYAKSIFGEKRPALIISMVMLTLYAFIFIIIQLEDTALLIGSIGLFIILAITMYISRKIDWGSVGVKKA